MLTLKESIQISLDGDEWDRLVDDQVMDKAEYFDIKDSPTLGSEIVLVHFYDEKYEELCSVKFSQPEIAASFLDEYFDIDEEDLEEIFSKSEKEDY